MSQVYTVIIHSGGQNHHSGHERVALLPKLTLKPIVLFKRLMNFKTALAEKQWHCSEVVSQFIIGGVLEEVNPHDHSGNHALEAGTNNKMSTHITLVYHHGGRLERNRKGVTVYSGGQVSLIPRVNVDTLNLFFMEGLFKDLGYIQWKNFYWGKPDAGGGVALKLLRLDRDVVNMYEDAIRNDDRVVHVYWEHTVDTPVEVEVVDVDVEEVPTPETANVNAETQVKPAYVAQAQHTPPMGQAQDTNPVAQTQTTQTGPPTTSEPGTQSQPNLQQDEVPTQESRAKQRNKRNSFKRPAPSGQTFVQGGIGEAPKIFVPRATSESSETDDDDSDPDYHQYESEELHSPYSSDCDSEYEAERNVWPQGNPNAAFGSVHLELGMEFETMEQFKRAVRKFNIQIGRSIIFSRVEPLKCKTICCEANCPWSIYCSRSNEPRSFQVKTFVNQHVCARSHTNKSADRKWVIEQLEEKLRDQRDFKTSEAEAWFRRELEREKEESNKWTPTWAGNDNGEIYEVEKHPTKLTGLPCRHACAALALRGRRPEDQIHNWLGMAAYNSAHQHNINPVPSKEFWEKAEGYPPLPPHYKTPIGRPTKKRRKKKNEARPSSNPHKLKRRYGAISCKYCEESGHNSRGCEKKTG
ncbi:hypothetical protein Ahy_A06g026031 [Arachis hypogaea]|uniref:Uncharacterized protein n=1 Tax=Arachis hypogaea TaxID=3818 RepID=A0A445CJ90_ARAHY|nr:hypothetical protein Ahy_A06g026031 [Arachis hypogaea]